MAPMAPMAPWPSATAWPGAAAALCGETSPTGSPRRGAWLAGDVRRWRFERSPLRNVGFMVDIPWYTMIYHDIIWYMIHDTWYNMIHDITWYMIHDTWYMIYHDIPWYTMIYHDIPWYTMIYHDIPWYTMIYHDTWYMILEAGGGWRKLAG